MNFNQVSDVIKNIVPDKADDVLERLSFDLPSHNYINIKSLKKHLVHVNYIFKFSINKKSYKSRLTSEEIKNIVNKCKNI
jgi:hypothetical protein